MKIKCLKCGISKDLDQFHKHRNMSYGIRKTCKKCRNHPKEPVVKNGFKICPKCNTSKPITEYYKDGRNSNGISCRCKECVKNHVNEWKKNNPEKRKLWEEKNKDRIRENNKIYYYNNKEKINEYNRNYERDKIKKAKSDKEYREKNIEKLRPKKSAYHNKKRREDLNYKLKCILRSRIYHALNAKPENQIKYKTTIELLGCSIRQFKKHLESLFTEGMSWENYGKWHIDHIRPCASFDLTDPEQQKKCFHYSNMQPLWKIDNLKKAHKVLSQTPALNHPL